MSLTVLTSAAEVLLATGHDPYVRGSLRRPDVSGWTGHHAVAWRATDAEERLPYLMTLGEPAAVARLVEELLPELRDQTRITLPRGTPALLPAWVALDGGDWDFRWISGPPAPQPGEERVIEPQDEEVLELLALASPTASAQPGNPEVLAWVGIRGERGLLACAADTSAATGVGHVSSIAVHPSARGKGLGAAVTAAIMRRMFAAGSDLVTLGMYADNAAGRALYDHLGMADEHRWTSGQLQIRSRW